MSTTAALSSVLLFVTALLAGCTDTAEGGTGSASVYVKDAPIHGFEEIHVVFTKVEVHAAGAGDDDGDAGDAGDDAGDADDGNDANDDGLGDADDGTGDDDAMDGDGNGTGDNATDDEGTTAGWHTIFESDGTHVDLLNASGDRAAFLGEAELESGKYTQIRVTVIEAFGITADGAQVNFTLASGKLRLNKPFTIEADKESRIILDFDLEAALHETGNGQWRMTPKVGSTRVEVVEDSESGEDVQQEGEITTIDNSTAP